MENKYNITPVPDRVFRAYDIRGIAGEGLTPDTIYTIGLALGSEAQEQGETKMVIARDARLSGPELIKALSQGLLDSGIDVVDIGVVPTPVLYYGCYFIEGTTSGAMLTASHNPGEYNGVKMVIKECTLSSEAIQDLSTRIKNNNFKSGAGNYSQQDIKNNYISRITSDIKLNKKLKIVIDSGNAICGELGPELMRKLGCDVIELHCELDGTFPNHQPDPSRPENMDDLVRAVTQHGADIGLCFDGDGDRMWSVTNKGEIITPDRAMMLFSKDLLERHPDAKILYDIKCTYLLPRYIKSLNGECFMWKTGHSFIKAKMREENAMLGGEMSGHTFFKERWYGFDDGMYSGARLCEILSKSSETASDIFNAYPSACDTPEVKIPVTESSKFTIMEDIFAKTQFPNGTASTIDGLRVDYEDGWGIIRASNTSPYIVGRFEGKDEATLKRIIKTFKNNLLKVDDQLAYGLDKALGEVGF